MADVVDEMMENERYEETLTKRMARIEALQLEQNKQLVEAMESIKHVTKEIKHHLSSK